MITAVNLHPYRFAGVLAGLAVVAVMAACGGQGDGRAVEPTSSVAVRQAADAVQVVNGCRIEPNTRCPGADLISLTAWEADLSGADLSRANMYKVSLSGANLSGANLSRAVLWGADLVDTDLRGADLSGATFIEAFLMEADLRGANLTNANLYRAVLDDADLTGAILTGAIMPDGKMYRPERTPTTTIYAER